MSDSKTIPESKPMSESKPRSSSLVIATRESELALWQTNHVKQLLESAHPELEISLLPMTTQGDQILDTPLYRSGGKGLFVKELEQALLDGRADLAVHSMKDVPTELPDGLGIHCLLNRADRRDAFVSNKHESFVDLPENAVVGTSSLRRQCLLKSQRPDLTIKVLRGNVNTRIRKLDEGQYDAIILACAGLDRLGWQNRIQERLDPTTFIPAPGQGIVGIECRNADVTTQQYLAPLNDALANMELSAERGFNGHLGGGCHVPIAVHSYLKDNKFTVDGLVGSADGKEILRASDSITLDFSANDRLTANSASLDRNSLDPDNIDSNIQQQAKRLGIKVAEQLLNQGAAELLASL